MKEEPEEGEEVPLLLMLMLMLFNEASSRIIFSAG